MKDPQITYNATGGQSMNEPIPVDNDENMIDLPEGATDQEDGAEVTLPVTGTISMVDGKKTLKVSSINDIPVVDEISDEDESSEDSGPTLDDLMKEQEGATQ